MCINFLGRLALNFINFNTQPMDMDLDSSSGATVSIKCSVTGDPPPSGQTWTFDDIYGSTNLALDTNSDMTCTDK